MITIVTVYLEDVSLGNLNRSKVFIEVDGVEFPATMASFIEDHDK